MMVRVIGASRHTIRQLRAIAPAGVDVVDDAIAEPDWILAATSAQRLEALASTGLPPFRVLEVPEVAAGLDQASTEALRTELAKMAGIGIWRSGASSLFVQIAALVVRRMMKRPWAGAAAATPEDAVPIGVGVAGIRTRIPAGERLDKVLKDRARERARRFASHTVRLD